VVSGVFKVANTKTAKKQILINERNHARNLHYKTRMKNVVKKVRAILSNPDVPIEEAKSALIEAQRVINQTSTKGVIHKNTASRKIGRLATLLNKTYAPEPVIEEPVEVTPPVVPVEAVVIPEPVVAEPVIETVEPVIEAEPVQEIEAEPVVIEVPEPELSIPEPEVADLDETPEVVDEEVEETEPTFHDSESPVDEEGK
jgi:small subunit ribosomal protein S20